MIRRTQLLRLQLFDTCAKHGRFRHQRFDLAPARVQLGVSFREALLRFRVHPGQLPAGCGMRLNETIAVVL